MRRLAHPCSQGSKLQQRPTMNLAPGWSSPELVRRLTRRRQRMGLAAGSAVEAGLELAEAAAAFEAPPAAA